MFDIQILYTGSGGNCSLVDHAFMVDCGVKKSEFIQQFDSIDALFITHRHSDHLSIPVLNWLYAKHYNWLKEHVYMNKESWDYYFQYSKVAFGLTLDDVQVIHDQQLFSFETRNGVYVCETFPLSHDVENQGFIFTNEAGKTLVWATDTRTMEYCPQRIFDVICCEGNYDEDKLYIDLMSDDFETQFRATRNLRHLSVQAFENFIREHRHKETLIYQLHESHDFGVTSPEALNVKTDDCP